MSGCTDQDGIDLSVVVVSRNTAALTERALAAIPEAAAPYRVEAICVDNDSQDGTADVLRSRLPSVRLLQNRRNLGYGAGFNRALPLARGRHVAVLNADTRPRPGALAHVVRFLDEHPEADVVAPAVVGPEGVQQVVARPEPSLAVLLHETTLLDVVRLGRRGAYAWRRG
ncbi:MAG: glycosyltransferase, partial [Planctomycetota bacterium]|nr:glycosyltransferase [Planctomycetota bacterium]